MWGPGTPWKTEAAFWAWMRGGLRRAVWNKHPIKLDKLKSSRYKAPIGVGGKEVWAIKCEECGGEFRQTSCQVDHIVGNISLRCEEDILPFVKHLAFIQESMIRCICKQCHDIKSYAERYGVSLEEAAIRKKEIACKKKLKI